MKKINKILTSDPRFKRFQKPLEAAEICECARRVAQQQYIIVSFSGGLLTVSCSTSAQAANLQAESGQIIEKINQKMGENKVKRIRFKIGHQ